MGDDVLVEVAEDRDWIWGRLLGCNQRGWIPLSAFQPVRPVPGHSVRVRYEISFPPAGVRDINFLILAVGEEVYVQHVATHGEWVWGQCGDRVGWAPTWAFAL